MKISATNNSNSTILQHQELMEENPIFYDMLVDISGHETLPGLEIFKEKEKGIFTARFKTHGYGIVITAERANDNRPEGYLYALAKPLFTKPDVDDMIDLSEGPLTYDTVYVLKDNFIELLIIK